MKSIRGEAVRFVVFGGINTVLTYAIYRCILFAAPYGVAYSLAYVIGVLSAYYFNSRYVFRTSMSVKRLLKYPVVYIVQYGLGIGLLYVLVDVSGVSDKIAPLVVIALTVPATFMMSRVIILRRQAQ